MDIKRFPDAYQSPKFTLERVTENYEAYYDIHYPLEERLSARGENKSPIYDWHKDNFAVFGEKASWERVNYYHNPADQLDESLRPYGWVGKHWHPAVSLEHHATRSTAGLFDESSFGEGIGERVEADHERHLVGVTQMRGGNDTVELTIDIIEGQSVVTVTADGQPGLTYKSPGGGRFG